jgi:hypothetical protein
MSQAETFEQGDEATDDAVRSDPAFAEELQNDPSLDPALVLDQRELQEVDSVLDDPERMAVLDGGMDDPDGVGAMRDQGAGDDDGWELDRPLTGNERSDDDA